MMRAGRGAGVPARFPEAIHPAFTGLKTAMVGPVVSAQVQADKPRIPRIQPKCQIVFLLLIRFLSVLSLALFAQVDAPTKRKVVMGFSLGARYV